MLDFNTIIICRPLPGSRLIVEADREADRASIYCRLPRKAFAGFGVEQAFSVVYTKKNYLLSWVTAEPRSTDITCMRIDGS